MNSFDSTIEKAIRNHEREVALLTRITDYDLYMSVRNVMRNNPDIFWFSHQWEYKKEEHKVFFRYTIDQERCEKIARQIDDVVKNDFKLDYVRTLSCREQMMYVYKWIALYCNYTILSAHNQTIYSVFVLRHSVCTGIAKAAQYLLKLLGIESRLVFGKMNNSEKDSRHCWLVVNIEGRWYHLDPTFALPETEHLLRQCGVEPLRGDDFLFYNFFSVDTATIKQSRTIEEEELLPVCIENVEHTILQNINVTPSRNGEQAGLGCLLSDVGTTAEIYLAHDKDKHNRHRAVAKVFKDDPEHELLRKELIVMRECAGPHLLRATDADFNKGILYIVQATPLSELLSSHYYKLTLKGLCNLLIDIASGLKELLDHGILYRDIHLNNIYLCEDPLFGKLTYKLGDFGSCTFVDKDGKFAGLTERGGVGSKWYMAPETWNEGVFDERSSVYGVGMIAYYLMNELFPPFWTERGEDSLKERIHPHWLQEPLLMRLIPNLWLPFIFRAMEYNPNERLPFLLSLISDINECITKNDPDLIIFDGSKRKSLQELRPASSPLDVFNNDDFGNNYGSTNQSNNFETTCVGSWNDCNDAYREDAVDFAIPPRQRINDFATSMALPPRCSQDCSPECSSKIKHTFTPKSNSSSFWSLLFGKKQDVYSSVFAPSEVKPKSRMMVQVYLHLNEETEKVKALATEADKNAERRDYIPLQTKLKKGDKVDVILNINGNTLLYNSRKSIIWQGSFCKCAFDYLVPSDIDVDELSSSVTLYVNGAIVGEMLFYTQIVDSPAQLYTNVIAKPVNKLFISYSHNDLKSAEKIAKLYEGMDVDVFFDKHRLKSGYIYSEEIFNFIRTADTFVLCWSENAAQSEYVEKERKAALELAYPNRKPRDLAPISIKPYNIPPYATPPEDMIEHYHFEEL